MVGYRTRRSLPNPSDRIFASVGTVGHLWQRSVRTRQINFSRRVVSTLVILYCPEFLCAVESQQFSATRELGIFRMPGAAQQEKQHEVRSHNGRAA